LLPVGHGFCRASNQEEARKVFRVVFQFQLRESPHRKTALRLAGDARNVPSRNSTNCLTLPAVS